MNEIILQPTKFGPNPNLSIICQFEQYTIKCCLGFWGFDLSNWSRYSAVTCSTALYFVLGGSNELRNKFCTKSITPINGCWNMQGFHFAGVAGVVCRLPFPAAISHDSNACHSAVGKMANSKPTAFHTFKIKEQKSLFRIWKKGADKAVMWRFSFPLTSCRHGYNGIESCHSEMDYRKESMFFSLSGPQPYPLDVRIG